MVVNRSEVNVLSNMRTNTSTNKQTNKQTRRNSGLKTPTSLRYRYAAVHGENE